MKWGLFGNKPGNVRFSTAVRALRKQGEEGAAQTIEKLKEEVGSRCPTHGELADPVIGTVGREQVAFGCPWCSGPEVLAAWEKEGMRS